MIDLAVILCVLGLLTALIAPALAKAKAKSRRIGCTCNLKQIGLSFRIFATDHSDLFPAHLSTNRGGAREFISAADAFRHFRVVSNELSTPLILACPADTRRPATNFARLASTNISYFVGLDANETEPQTLLAGDRNLTINGVPAKPGLLTLTTNSAPGFSPAMHQGAGNVALGDGSVQQFTSARLWDQVSAMGVATSRLLIP